MSEKKPLGFGRIGHCSAIKALSFIPHANQYLSIHAATAGDVNLLIRILVIAVNHRIGESFMDGDFKFLFTLLRDANFSHETFDEMHELIYE